MKTTMRLLIYFIPFLLVSAAAPPRVLTPDLIIAEVNALRASQGLEAYTVDPWLMAYAQEHASYMAFTGLSTHTHSDGTVPWEIGIQENVAGGTSGYIDASFIVYQVWADPVHGKVMTGYASGEVGAGVASDGELDYISLNVRPGSAVVKATALPATPVGGTSLQQVTAAPGTSIPPVPIQTATPQQDGSVYHTVGPGQTLWSIAQAYGITVDRLLLLNGFPDENVTIYVGQRLLIKIPPPAITVTVSNLPTATPTIDPLQLTPSATASPTVRVAPTQPPLPSPTPTTDAEEERVRNERLARTLILVAAILAGFILLYYLAFRGPRRY